MTNFPKPTDLVSSIDFRLNPTFETHPTELGAPKPFDAFEFVHRLVTVRPRGKYDGPLGVNDVLYFDFLVETKTRAPQGHTGFGQPFDPASPLSKEEQVRAFIKETIGDGLDYDELTGQGIVPTPYDIPVKKQCFIILELDRKLKWRFTKGSPGVTTQEFHGADNFGLVWRKGAAAGQFSDPAREPTITVDDCKVLYFRVGRRRTDVQKLNFHIEFEWAPGKYIPLIFDPSIPDNGGASFP